MSFGNRPVLAADGVHGHMLLQSLLRGQVGAEFCLGDEDPAGSASLARCNFKERR
jgi:hypothetical protein